MNVFAVCVSVFDIKDTVFIKQFNSIFNGDHVLSDLLSSVVIELSLRHWKHERYLSYLFVSHFISLT